MSCRGIGEGIAIATSAHDAFPWFRDATIGQLARIERPIRDHLRLWERSKLASIRFDGSKPVGGIRRAARFRLGGSENPRWDPLTPIVRACPSADVRDPARG
jgi:hypothetical protein